MISPRAVQIRDTAKSTLKRLLFCPPEDARRAEELEAFTRELYALCRRPKVGLNPLAVFSIAVHETNFFRSQLWIDNLNPGGLKNATATGYQKYINGVDAARALVVHVLMYVDGKAGNLGKYRILDERASAVTKAGYGATVVTLADFRSKWATDVEWPEKVAARYDYIRTLQYDDNPIKPDYIEDRTRIVPTGRRNTPNLRLEPDHIAVHDTGNQSMGAGAYAHNDFLWAGGGPESVSFHWAVDDSYVVQNVATDMVTWQAGDGYYGKGNRKAESYEICINSDGDYVQALHNAAHHVAKRLKARGWKPDSNRLRPGKHQDFSGKYCPGQMLRNRDGISWGDFVGLVNKYYATL